MPKTSSGNARVNLFIIIVFLLSGLVAYRLFNITFTRHDSLSETAKAQYEKPSASLSGRGEIYFGDYSTKNRKLAATNKELLFVYSNNESLDVKNGLSEKLAAILEIEPAAVAEKLSDKNRSYQLIKNEITSEQAAKIKSLKIQGLNIGSGTDRFYIFDNLASTVLGFVGFRGDKRAGQYGLEAYYDDVLRGGNPEFFGTKTYAGFSDFIKSFFGNKEKPEVTGGSDLILTIDTNIQSMVEVKLDETLKKWSSDSGSVIVQDPNTGAILAMASRPNFNPNNYGEYKLQNFINSNVQEVYEPGSSFKPITMAAALNSGALTPEATYNDTGEVRIGGYTIRNFDSKAHNTQTMRQVLEKSLNTGVVFAQEKTGDDTFLNHVVSFGFGQKTGIDLTGEVIGNISNLFEGRRINFATASFGQGIAVTPIQLVNAYSAIANGGRLMKPHVVKKIIGNDGSGKEISPAIIDSPISEKTASILRSMLVDVVDKGFDKARIKGYDVAGKTGTAQIPSGSGGYLGNDEFIHNFVGFAPANSAKFTILIKMDKPKGIKFAADSLSPVFGDIARFLIRYYNIPPTR